MPDAQGGAPSWGQRAFPKGYRAGQWVTLASGNPAGDALPIRADARVLGATLNAGETLTLDIDPARHLYLVPATGAITVNGVSAHTRDGVAMTGESELRIHAVEDAELVLVDAR